jgi:hypothetical protein
MLLSDNVNDEDIFFKQVKIDSMTGNIFEEDMGFQ